MRYVIQILVCVMMAFGCATEAPIPTTEPERVMVGSLEELFAAAGPTNPIEECQCSGGNLCCRDADRSTWWCYPWICAAGSEADRDAQSEAAPAVAPVAPVAEPMPEPSAKPGDCYMRGCYTCCMDDFGVYRCNPWFPGCDIGALADDGPGCDADASMMPNTGSCYVRLGDGQWERCCYLDGGDIETVWCRPI